MMTRLQLTLTSFTLLVLASLVACGDSTSNDQFKQNPTVPDVNNPNSNNPNNDPFIPEEEKDYEFTLPAVVDGKVYVANETLNTVAVIDSANLSINTIPVGFRPTQIVGPSVLDAQKATITVLNSGSNSVTVIDPEKNEAKTVPVMPGANTLTASPAGDAVIAWYNDTKIGVAGDLSSVSLIKDGQAFAVAVGFHVREVKFTDNGQKALILSDDGVSVLTIADITRDTLAAPLATLPPELRNIDPRDLEVLLDSDGRFAITRISSARAVAMLDIEQNTHHVVYLPEAPTDVDLVTGQNLEVLVMLRQNRVALRMTMPDGVIAASMVTSPANEPASMNADMSGDMAGADMGADLGSDMSADMPASDMNVDMTGADMAPDLAGSDMASSDMPDMVVDMAPATDMTADQADMNSSAEQWGIEAQGVSLLRFDRPFGAAVVSSDGSEAILYTTVGQERRVLLYHFGTNTGDALFLEKGVRGVTADSRGETFILFHSREAKDDMQPTPDRPADPGFIADSYGLSIVDVATATARLVLTEQEPRLASLWSHPQTDPYVYVIFETPELTALQQPSHRDVLVVNLRSFRIDSFRVPSLTEGVGVIPDALRVYVSQRHPQGRMTFVDVQTQRRQTITGYQLNAGIE